MTLSGDQEDNFRTEKLRIMSLSALWSALKIKRPFRTELLPEK